MFRKKKNSTGPEASLGRGGALTKGNGKKGGYAMATVGTDGKDRGTTEKWGNRGSERAREGT